MTAPVERPEGLAPDEPILWQGRPSWRALAVGALHIRAVALYFVALALWRVASGLSDGESAAAALLAAAASAPAAFAAIGLLAGFAWLSARTTRYTITPQRVVMEIGVALSMTLNVPFRIVGAAGLRLDRDGTGDIPLALTEGRVAYLTLWPHARPWRIAHPEPMLRAVPDAAAVAETLAQALGAFAASARPVAINGRPEAPPLPAGRPALAA